MNENMLSVDLESNRQTQTQQTNKRKLDESSVKIKSILKHSEPEPVQNGDNVDGCVKTCCITFTTLLYIPLPITSLYYAYTDNSCVHEKAGKLSINLFNYLAVDGILGIMGVCVALIMLHYLGPDGYINAMKSGCGFILLCISWLFSVIWTIIGSFVFWDLMDNNKCNKGIYNYVFALLIIHYVLLFINSINFNKNK
jgi:hypothetical protein